MIVFAIVGLVSSGWSGAGDEASGNGAVSDGIREAEIRQAARELVELAKVEGSDQAAIDRAQLRFLDLAVALNRRDLVRPVLAEILELTRSPSSPPGAGAVARPQAEQDLIEQVAEMIDAELSMRGRGRYPPPFPCVAWDALADKYRAAVRSGRFPSRRQGAPSWLGDRGFLAEMEHLANVTFAGGNQVRVLVDGPDSFVERERLISQARESLWIMSWAFYDDRTGFSFAQKLISRHAAGIDVRIMVDGAFAGRADHDEVTRQLEAAGIPLIRWRSVKHPYYGMHRKLFIADQRTVICGGLNFGDAYSHLGVQEERERWRDTDVLVEGPATAQASALFVRLWNAAATEQDAGRPLAFPHGAGGQTGSVPEASCGVSSGDCVAFVDHHPLGCSDDPIYLLTLKAIAGATEIIDINNAYFVPTPPLKAALCDALQRGVRVRILSNSAESLDEPILRRPIALGLRELREAGAQVFCKTGSTLHSKIFVADRRFGWVGSYNLHPRSYRYEGETVAAFWSDRWGRELSDLCDRDTAAARPVRQGDELDVPPWLPAELATRYFFDQL
jgi:cardiolipin synthase